MVYSFMKANLQQIKYKRPGRHFFGISPISAICSPSIGTRQPHSWNSGGTNCQDPMYRGVWLCSWGKRNVMFFIDVKGEWLHISSHLFAGNMGGASSFPDIRPLPIGLVADLVIRHTALTLESPFKYIISCYIDEALTMIYLPPKL